MYVYDLHVQAIIPSVCTRVYTSGNLGIQGVEVWILGSTDMAGALIFGLGAAVLT